VQYSFTQGSPRSLTEMVEDDVLPPELVDVLPPACGEVPPTAIVDELPPAPPPPVDDGYTAQERPLPLEPPVAVSACIAAGAGWSRRAVITYTSIGN
jgi:hypothetical protein